MSQIADKLFERFSPKTLGSLFLGFLIVGGGIWFFGIEPVLDRKTEENKEETITENFPQESNTVPEIIEKDEEEKKIEELAPPSPPIPTDRTFQAFGTARLSPDMNLNGKGSNIDSPEFFEADTPDDTLLFVTGKSNDTVEIWRFPFQEKELSPIKRSSLPNGIAIDQDRDLLFIGDSDKQQVDIHHLPDLKRVGSFGEGDLKSGETNVDILTLKNGVKQVYVTESHGIDVFDLDSKKRKFSFSPNVESIEEVLADSFHQIIYVPEENGVESKKHKGGAITAYSPDGKPFLKNGSHTFGNGVFQGDGEGITLYKCSGSDGKDTGRGFIIAADQHSGAQNGFEFFDRESWKHLGTLYLTGVTTTDGISASNRPLAGYPQGLFAASNNDTSTVVVSWEKIAEATNLHCQ